MSGASELGCASDGVRLVALDLDGVVWRGGQVLPGAPEALTEVLRRGLDLRYVSNNSTAHRETVSERLEGMGLPAGVERVLTSGFIAGRWLRERLPERARVMVLGESGLLRELREAGLDALHVGEAAAKDPVPEAVVVGMDRSFSYEALAAAQAAIMGGALFVATNRDATFPTPDGLTPGAGSIVAAVATAAEQEPVLMGKPGPALAVTLAAVTGVPPAQTLFVGDRLSTDIAMGHEAGMITALVLTGVTSLDDLRRARTVVGAAASEAAAEGAEAAAGEIALPDHVMSDLRDLPPLLDRLRCADAT
jgi:4-nitrophenyl phosphatase